MQRGFRRYLKAKQAQSGERHARPKVSRVRVRIRVRLRVRLRVSVKG